MGRPSSVPKYRRRVIRGKEIAYVSLWDGINRVRKDYALGPFGSPESRSKYARLVQEFEGRGRQLTPVAAPAGDQAGTMPRIGLSVCQVAAAFIQNQLPTYARSEQGNFRTVIRIMSQLYGDVAATSFGPKALRAVRQAMIDGDAKADPQREPWNRKSCNKQVIRIRAIFRWAVSQELIPVAVFETLKTVESLKRGRTTAKESERVKPVPDWVVDATLPFLRTPVRSMVELQRLTGMRSGEVVIMRACDIDMSGDVWTYIPTTHKTAHHDHARTVALGPRAQAIVRRHMTIDLKALLFRPADAVAELQAERASRRKTKPLQGSYAGKARTDNPKRTSGPRYTVDSYRRAIERACNAAETQAVRRLAAAGQERPPGRQVPRWFPHQLRHLYGTAVRRIEGVEAARIVLGHQHIDVTEIYAERDAEVALRIAKEIG